MMVPDPNNRTVVECAIVRNGSVMRSSRSCSSSLVVGDSPVVPLMTSPSLRMSSTRYVASRAAPS